MSGSFDDAHFSFSKGLCELVYQAKQILEEEQAGFRSQTSTAEQIFSLRLLVERKTGFLKSPGRCMK